MKYSYGPVLLWYGYINSMMWAYLMYLTTDVMIVTESSKSPWQIWVKLNRTITTKTYHIPCAFGRSRVKSLPILAGIYIFFSMSNHWYIWNRNQNNNLIVPRFVQVLINCKLAAFQCDRLPIPTMTLVQFISKRYNHVRAITVANKTIMDISIKTRGI